MHENANTFRHNHYAWGSSCIQAKKDKPIPGYSLINEVIKKPSANEARSKNMISPRAKAAEDTEKTPLSKLTPEKCMHIGTDLAQEERDRLIDFLHESKDIFTWSVKDL